MALDLPFDLGNPPEAPPPGCLDPEKWVYWCPEYRRHQRDRSGRCGHKLCEQRWPCFGWSIAVRALIDACAGRHRSDVLPGPPRIVATATCRSCKQAIERHSLYGWVHVSGAFLLCRGGATRLLLGVAEPEAS
jgi:hypothetical protein